MKKLIIIILLISSILALNLSADEKKEVFMVYGPDFMVNIPLPKYWNVDMDFASNNNLNAFFYIEKYSLANSPVGIIMTLAEKPNDEVNLEDYIAYDISGLREYYTEYEISEKLIDIVQEYDYLFKFYEFKKEGNIRYQLISYLDCGTKYYVKIYIDCKDKSISEYYIVDFIESITGLNYMNITLEQE